MRTKELFGVQFARSGDLKEQLLTDFTGWKEREIKRQLGADKAKAVDVWRTLGFSEDEVSKLLAEDNIFEYQPPDYSKIKDLLKEDGCHHYLVTGPVLEMCDKIRIKPPYDVSWLAPVPDGKRQLNFGNRFIRYHKEGPHITALSVSLPQSEKNIPYLRYAFFKFDLAANLMSQSSIPDDYDPLQQEGKAFVDFDESSKKLFLQLVTFMELADVEEVVVAPGAKHGNRKLPDNLLNEEKFPITIVNTNWNRIIRTHGFDVSGHFRKQAYGPGLSKRRLTWIDPFHKDGYNLKARSLHAGPHKGPKL